MPSFNLYTLFLFALAPGSIKAEQVRLPGSPSQTKHRNAAWSAVSGVWVGFYKPRQEHEPPYASLSNVAHHLNS